MNRHEILLLQQKKNGTALTITLPTHRTSPENKQDRIRLENLVKQATNSLITELGKKGAEPIVARLESLVANLDYRYLLDGLALFVNADFARAVMLPVKQIEERVKLGDSFFTRDLVFALNRTPRYWVLVLSEKPTRLYEAARDDFVEIKVDGFPLVHEGPGGAASLPGGFGIKKSAYRDEYHRKFFRSVDANLRPFLNDDPLPLVIVGVDRYLAFFDEVTKNKSAVIAMLSGSHDKTSPAELAKLVWPLVKDWQAKERQKALQVLSNAVGERRVKSSIDEVWLSAKHGNGILLFVEEAYHHPAVVDQSGLRLLPPDDLAASEQMIDVVDEIIDMVLLGHGQVIFVPQGELVDQKIALIVRD